MSAASLAGGLAGWPSEDATKTFTAGRLSGSGVDGQANKTGPTTALRVPVGGLPGLPAGDPAHLEVLQGPRHVRRQPLPHR